MSRYTYGVGGMEVKSLMDADDGLVHLTLCRDSGTLMFDGRFMDGKGIDPRYLCCCPAVRKRTGGPDGPQREGER